MRSPSFSTDSPFYSGLLWGYGYTGNLLSAEDRTLRTLASGENGPMCTPALRCRLCLLNMPLHMEPFELINWKLRMVLPGILSSPPTYYWGAQSLRAFPGSATLTPGPHGFIGVSLDNC